MKLSIFFTRRHFVFFYTLEFLQGVILFCRRFAAVKQMLTPSTQFLFLTQGGFQDVLKYKIAKCTFVKFALAGTCKRFREQFYDKDMTHILYYIGFEKQRFLTSAKDINVLKLAYILFPFTIIPNLQTAFEKPRFYNDPTLLMIHVGDVPDLRKRSPYVKRNAWKSRVPNHLLFMFGCDPDWREFWMDVVNLECDEFKKCEFLEKQCKRETFRLCQCCKDAEFFEYTWSVNQICGQIDYKIKKTR